MTDAALWSFGAVDPDDYRALRHGAGAVAVGRDVLEISGPDALEYLQGQLSQDVAVLEVGASADGLLLSPQGKLDALVRVTRLRPDAVVLDVDAGFGDATRQRLERFKLRVKATIEPLGWRCTALRGPDVDVAARDRAGAAPGVAVAVPYSWNGVSGVDLLGDAPAVPPGVRSCGAAAAHAVRVEAGIPAMGHELDERTIAAEAGLLERTVSFTKGCYTGQELVARLDARGNRVARHLRGLVAPAPPAGPAPSGGPAPSDPEGFVPGADIVAAGKTVGTVTSVAWSPALGRAVALGYVHRSVGPAQAVEVVAPSGRTSAEVRTLPLVPA